MDNRHVRTHRAMMIIITRIGLIGLIGTRSGERRRVSDARLTFDGFTNDDDIIVLGIVDPIDPREGERRRYARAYAAEEESDSDTPVPEYQEERGGYSRSSRKGKAKETSSRLEEESASTSRTGKEPERSRKGKEPESSSSKGKEPESYSSRDPDPQSEIPQQSGGMFNWCTDASHQEIVDFLLDLGHSTNSSVMEQQRAILVEEMTAPEENGHARILSEEALDYYRVAVESLYTAIQSQSQGANDASDERSYDQRRYDQPRYGQESGGQSSRW
ncbi:hypothetical protein JCM24511_09441 [Saitozyma sp. JCM 24511]|nr:hypothetical protein JCM24511_09441 [Saitozyma sp. JCM 24511]